MYVYDRFVNQDQDIEMVPRGAIGLKVEPNQPVATPAVKLAKGSELVLIAALEGHHTGATILLRDLVISDK